jgi:hypothetical protein
MQAAHYHAPEARRPAVGRRVTDRAAIRSCSCSTDHAIQRESGPHEKEQLGTDLLEFLNATNERAAHESCHVHA